MAYRQRPLVHVSFNHPAYEKPGAYANPKCKTCDGKGIVWVFTGSRRSCDVNEPVLCGCTKKNLNREV